MANNTTNVSSGASYPDVTDLSQVDYDHMEDVVFITRLDSYIDRLGNIIAWAFLVSVAISFYEIASRYLFDSPTIWVHETTIMICALCMAYGGTYCLARDSHIRIRILYDAVGEKGKRVLDIINALLTLFFCVLLTYAAYIMTEKALFTPMGDWRLETTGSAWNPIYPAIVKFFLFAVLILMSLQSLLHLFKAVTQKPAGAV